MCNNSDILAVVEATVVPIRSSIGLRASVDDVGALCLLMSEREVVIEYDGPHEAQVLVRSAIYSTPHSVRDAVDAYYGDTYTGEALFVAGPDTTFHDVDRMYLATRYDCGENAWEPLNLLAMDNRVNGIIDEVTFTAAAVGKTLVLNDSPYLAVTSELCRAIDAGALGHSATRVDENGHYHLHIGRLSISRLYALHMQTTQTHPTSSVPILQESPEE